MRDIKYTRTLVYQDRDYADFQGLLRLNTSSLENSLAELEGLAPKLAVAEEDAMAVDMIVANALTALVNHVSKSGREDTAAAYYLIQLRESVRARYNQLLADHERLERRVRDYQLRIAQNKEQLLRYSEGYDPIITLTKEDVAAKFKHVSNIDPDSIALGTYAEAPCLRFVVSGIFLRPNFNSCRAFIPAEKIEIALDPIEVLVMLREKAVRFFPLERSGALYCYSSPAPHPHVLNEYGEPCLGDYGGAVIEAIDGNDWETLASLVYMFLSNCDAEDSAGRHWCKGLRAYNEDGKHQTLLPYGLDSAFEGHIIADPEHRGFFIHVPKEAGEYGLAA